MTELTTRQKRELAEAWGRALRRLRDRAKLTQMVAAERVGVEQGTYSRYESGGNTSLLDPETQRKVSLALSDHPEALAEEFSGLRPEPVEIPTNPFAVRSPLIYPLIGRARAGLTGQQVFNEEDPGEYDFGRVLDRYTQLVRVTGESMVPILEPGDIVAMDTNGYPKRNSLAVVILEDGSYYVKKFVRMTDTEVHCIEMETVDVQGRTAYAERPLTYPIIEVRAVYPAFMRIE